MKRMIATKASPFLDKIDIHFAEYSTQTSNDKYAVAVDLIMKTVDESTVTKPFISIDYQEAQELIDTLWQCGLRPSEGSGSAGSLAATERHLKDMKQIAFHALKIK